MAETPEEKAAREAKELAAKATTAGADPAAAVDIINSTPPPDPNDPKAVMQYLKDIRDRLDLLIEKTKKPEPSTGPTTGGSEGTPPKPGETNPIAAPQSNPPVPDKGTPVPGDGVPAKKPLLYWE